MPSLNVDLDLEQHPKMRRLQLAVGETAMLYVIRLWVHVAKFYPGTGRMDSYTDEEVNRVVNWTRSDLNLAAHLRASGFIRQGKKGPYIHDWKEHAGHIIAYKIRGKSNALKRWGGHATSIATGIATSNAPTEQIRQSRAEQKKNPESRAVAPVDKSRPRIPGEADWQPISDQLQKLRKGGP